MRFSVFRQPLFKSILTIAVLLLGGIIYEASAATIVVPSGGDLQGAINAANCGDEISLQAGATFAGNFILKYKGPCTGTDSDFITIRASNLAGLTPAGTRITPAQAQSMPIVLANSVYPALEAEPNAHHYKLIGINFVNIGGSVFTPEIINIGKRSSGGDIPFAEHPHHIIFDRDWIHEATNDTTTPDSAATTSDRGMDINATDIVVTECRIAGFRAYVAANGPGSAEASNAILFPYSALRVTVTNSYLEAWFAPVFFGGSGGETPNTATLTNPTFNTTTNSGSAIFSTVQNLNLGDLVAFKTTGGTQPPGAVCSSCPCLVEIAKVTAINGHTVSYVAAGAKGDLNKGNPLRQVPDAPGEATWNGYLNQDITIQRSQIVLNFNATEWEWINSGGDPTTAPRAQQLRYGHGPKAFIEIKMARNVTIFGNTFEGWHNALVLTARNQGNTVSGNAFPWSGLFNINISNNYFKRTPNWNRLFSGIVGGPALEDSEFTTVRSGPVTITNNLFDSGVEEIFLSMTSADNITLSHNTYPGSATPLGRASMIFAHTTTSNGFVFKDNILGHNEYGMNCQSGPAGGCWSNLQMARNVIIDNRSDAGKIGDGPLESRYPNDLIASSLTTVGWVDPAAANYRLASNSPFKNRGSGGADPGVDMDQLLAALGGTLPLPSPTPTPSPSSSPTATPTPQPSPQPSPQPTPVPAPSGETLWISGALPAGAIGYADSDGWNWSSSNPVPYAAPLAHQSIVSAGIHQHYFVNATATMTPATGEVLFTYVYLDPANPPSEIMLQWSTNSTDFDHRAFWGANNIAWGTAGTDSRRYMGPLPAAGQWARLEIPASQVGLEAKAINGMAFTLFAGKASWDRSGKAGASVPSPTPTPLPTPSPSVSPSPTPMPTPTPTPTPGGSMQSPASVLVAKEHAASLVDQMGGPALGHHATKAGFGPSSTSVLASDLEALANDIQTAYQDFLVERNMFGARGPGIDTQLSGALLFARADAALAAKTGNTPSVAMHLDRIISHLTMTEDLMLYGSISAMTAEQAVAARARIDLLIGSASAGYSQPAAGALAAAGLASMFSNVGEVFCTQPFYAASNSAIDNYELGGVSVIVGGHAAQLVYVSPARLAFVVPAEVAPGSAEVIVTSQDGYLSRGFTSISRNVFRLMTANDEGTGEAVAMNLVKQTANGFDVVTAENFGADKRTRVALFTVGISGGAVNSNTANDIGTAAASVANFAESVAVEARKSNGQIVNLSVEFAGAARQMIGLDQVNIRLPAELRAAGVVELTLIVGGQRSNSATIVIR